MRLHVDDYYGDDEYKRGLSTRAVILLNEKIIKHCIEANEEDGYIICYKTDENGNHTVVGDELAREKLRGDVQIIDPENNQ